MHFLYFYDFMLCYNRRGNIKYNKKCRYIMRIDWDNNKLQYGVQITAESE